MDFADQASTYETMHRNMTIQARQDGQPSGQSLMHCEACGAPIPKARQEAIKGVRLCVDCQGKKECAHG